MPIDWETQPISIKSVVKIKGESREHKVLGVDWCSEKIKILRWLESKPYSVWVSFERIESIRTPQPERSDPDA